jgi:hypothetical protein
MKFPKEKMRFSSAYGGDRAEEGWLLLDVKGMDLEGVSQIAINLADVRELKAKGDEQGEALKRARNLLGGSEEE